MSEPVQIALWLAAAALGLALSALYSGLETGIYSLDRLRLRLGSESGQTPARTLSRLMRDNRSLLGTLLIGNNVSNYLGAAAVAALCTLAGLGTLATTLLVPVLLAPMLVVLGEIVPKNIFRRYSERYTYSLAWFLLGSRRAFTAVGLLPLVNAFTALAARLGRWDARQEGANPFHPRQQLRYLLSETQHTGALTPYQSALAERVMNLRNVRLASAMVPLARVRSVRLDIDHAAFGQLLATHNFSRVPVFRDRPDNIVGVVNTIDVISSPDPGRPVAEFVYDTVDLSADSSVVHALFSLQRARRAMGIVRDGRGRAIGIVTMKDLVEEITGEIEEW